MAIKVLHILNKLNPSGAEVMLEIASKYWQENGVLSEILSTEESKGDYEPILEKAGYNVTHIELKPYLKFIITSYKLLKNSDYDIIHIHSEAASLFIAIAARLAGKNHIIRTVHHIWPRRRILPFIKRYIYRFISNKFLGVLAVSNSVSGLENEIRYFNAYNKLIPNWYDDNKFKPLSLEDKKSLREKYDIPIDEIIVTSLGGNWEYKNYWMIIEALSQLSLQSKIRYFQIGPEGNDNPLQELAKKLSVLDKVYFWGKVENVLLFLQMSDYYIMPSTEEGFGNAAIEAMSTGLKPILSDVKALCDFKNYYVESDVIWIQPKTDEIFRAFEIIENNELNVLNDEFRFKLHETTKRNFGLNVGACEYLKLYKQIYGEQNK